MIGAGHSAAQTLQLLLDADEGRDRRGRQSASLLLVRAQAGYGGLDNVAADLRVDDAILRATSPLAQVG